MRIRIVTEGASAQSGCHPGRSEAKTRDRRKRPALASVPDRRAARLSGMTASLDAGLQP